MKRCTLHKSKLEDFKEYLIQFDIKFREGKGDYQVIQVEVLGRFYPVFKRHGGDHYTTQKELLPTIKNYLSWSSIK